MIETKKTFCRFCHVFCGMEVDVEQGRVVAVRGDRDNEVTIRRLECLVRDNGRMSVAEARWRGLSRKIDTGLIGE